eukprot:CAMPEP_0176423358 /NCGR_PEP_ID=MMETSP0127-20121128/10237_1 /TAXON_ID=938130 /ORGANISM="Platyophrya macrostoma, Strain WH" /LENGTH=402 /DNA_ID=CAMNT_0017804295 /DNA_START=205 /DNA_END=1413 /DNA_ORIENTATION=+
MLLVFEDLNGDVVRYSTHGLYDPEEYFRESWSHCERSFTAKEYPDFFKVKQYKKVLERRERKMMSQIKEETDSTTKNETSMASEDHDYLNSLKKNERESRTIKEKIALSKGKKGAKKGAKGVRETPKAKPDTSIYAFSKSKGSARNQRNAEAVAANSSAPRHSYNTRRDNTSHTQAVAREETNSSQHDDQSEANFQVPPQRTPQLFGLGSDMRMPEMDRQTPNIFGLSGSEFDLRSPGLGYLLHGNKQFNKLFEDPHFMKPGNAGNGKGQYYNHGIKEEGFESPRLGNLVMTPDIMQPQGRDRRSSFESYFHMLRRDSDADLMKKMASPSPGGFKLRSPNLQSSNRIDGVASYLNLNGGSQNLESFQLEGSGEVDNHQLDNNQLNINFGHEPETKKRVKKGD